MKALLQATISCLVCFTFGASLLAASAASDVYGGPGIALVLGGGALAIGVLFPLAQGSHRA